MNKKQFLEIAPPFAAAVIKQIGGWNEFKQQAEDIANHGGNNGTGGFIYYSETEPFAQDNIKAIMDYTAQLASDIGESDEYQMIADFNCFKGEYTSGRVARAIYAPEDDDKTQILNALAWFALEETARAYMDAQQ